VRVLYVFKYNPQDPTEIAIRRWLGRVFPDSRCFRFAEEEKKRGSEENGIAVNARLLEAARAYRPTHVLCWVPYLNVEEVRALKALGAKVAASVNGISSFSTGTMTDQALFLESLRALDVYLVPHFPHVEPLRAAGVNAVRFPFCVDPETYRPAPVFEAIGRALGIESVFIGNFGPADNAQGKYRAALIRELARAGKTLLVSDGAYAEHGLREVAGVYRVQLPNFQRQKWLNRVLNLGSCSVGVDGFPEVEIYNKGLRNQTIRYENVRDGFTMRPRTFWSLGAGRVLLLERYPDIEAMFEDGKEILFWREPAEARAHVERLVADPAARARIAHAGRARVLAHHTAEVRLRELGELWK
jgi:spore maturation protein CgeB